MKYSPIPGKTYLIKERYYQLTANLLNVFGFCIIKSNELLHDNKLARAYVPKIYSTEIRLDAAIAYRPIIRAIKEEAV